MDESPLNRSEFLLVAAICEGSLFALALVLAWFLDVNPQTVFYFDLWSVAVGVLATIPLLILFAFMYRADVGPFRQIRDLLHGTFSPILCECNWLDIVLLALLAGLCEEVLFRGTVQLWLSQWGLPVAVVGASVLFGLVHCVTATYILIAALIGAYLSWTMYFVGRPNLLVPVVTHAVYDYIAFLVLIADYKRNHAGRLAVDPQEQ